MISVPSLKGAVDPITSWKRVILATIIINKTNRTRSRLLTEDRLLHQAITRNKIASFGDAGYTGAGVHWSCTRNDVAEW